MHLRESLYSVALHLDDKEIYRKHILLYRLDMVSEYNIIPLNSMNRR